MKYILVILFQFLIFSCIADDASIITPDQLCVSEIMISSIPDSNQRGEPWESDGTSIDAYLIIFGANNGTTYSDTLYNINIDDEHFIFSNPLEIHKDTEIIAVRLRDYDPHPFNQVGLASDELAGHFTWFPWSDRHSYKHEGELTIPGARYDEEIRIKYIAR